jgi:hypothetical protein
MQLRNGRWIFALWCVLACHPVQPVPQSEAMTAALPSATDSIQTDSDSASALYTTVLARDAVDSGLVSTENRQRKSIDSLSKHAPERTLLAYGLPNGRIMLQRDSSDLPDSSDVGYAVLRDNSGQIVRASASPLSESGDWLVTETHYFDSAGSTIVMERYASVFDGCTSEDGDSTVGIKEMATSYFDPQHRLIRRSFVRTTFNDSTPAPMKNCNRSFQVAYRIYPSWDSLATATGLERVVRPSHN